MTAGRKKKKKRLKCHCSKTQHSELGRQTGVMSITKMGVVALTNRTGEVVFAAVPKQDKNLLWNLSWKCSRIHVAVTNRGALPWYP